MPKKAQRTNPFEGDWQIAWMEAWDQDFVDAEEEGYFQFEPAGAGHFHFGYVNGQIDYRLSTRDGQPCVEFSRNGSNEMDAAQGRGWAVVEGDELRGEIFFHLGDDSAFRAQRKQAMRK